MCQKQSSLYYNRKAYTIHKRNTHGEPSSGDKNNLLNIELKNVITTLKEFTENYKELREKYNSIKI